MQKEELWNEDFVFDDDDDEEDDDDFDDDEVFKDSIDKLLSNGCEFGELTKK